MDVNTNGFVCDDGHYLSIRQDSINIVVGTHRNTSEVIQLCRRMLSDQSARDVGGKPSTAVEMAKDATYVIRADRLQRQTAPMGASPP